MKLNIKTSTNCYDIIIKNNELANVGEYFNLNRKVLIISDDKVPYDYVLNVLNQCKQGYTFIFKSGEESKNINTYQQIISCLISNNFTRSDCIVAVGGGVVGDLSGFVASTYMRGIAYYNVPTTLLSQVDSSIGGKTAVDFNGIKNIVGAFYPPSAVLIDPCVLKTLSKRQLHSGLVEAIKMSLTHDETLFELIKNSNDLYKDINEIIYKSLLIKKKVVESDEKESGVRKVLNFGHTFGHAIESDSNLSLLHGECVGLGMLYFSSKEVKTQLKEVLTKYDLPTKYDGDEEKLLNLIRVDKKASGEYIDIVLVNKIGNYQIKKVLIKDLKEDLI